MGVLWLLACSPATADSPPGVLHRGRRGLDIPQVCRAIDRQGGPASKSLRAIGAVRVNAPINSNSADALDRRPTELARGRGFALVLRHKGGGCDAFASTCAVNAPDAVCVAGASLFSFPACMNRGTHVNIRASSRSSCMSRVLSHSHDNCSLCRSSTDSEPHTPSSAGRSAMAPQCIMSSRSPATR